MLEAIRSRSQGWIAKTILVLITVPFALFGVDSYLRNAGSKATVAEVNGDVISVQEFNKSLQDARNQQKDDPNFLQNPEARRSVLDKMITKRLLQQEVKRGGYLVTDEQLSTLIVNLPEFQGKDGTFSQDTYDKLLAANGMTPKGFEAMMRRDLLVQQMRDGIVSTAFTPDALVDVALHAKHQLREISVATLQADSFADQAKVNPADVKSYYDKHQDEFRRPEQVRLEFLVLSVGNIVLTTTVTDDEIKDFYQQNASKYQGDESRRASHILIAFGSKPDAAAKAAAKKKALEVLAEVKKSPDKFAELAKKYSQDPGSADKGGDLGFSKRGDGMVKPFEDALFGMSPGSISGLVETEFGYHIIKLSEVKGSAQTYDQVRNQIRGELMTQKALSKFADVAETFSNTVYEQSTSLEPAAKANHLEVQKSGWMSREDVAGFFKNNDKLAAAVFSDEVLKDKRNTEAVEIAPNTLAAARVIESRPPSIKPFDDVKADIEAALKKQQSAMLALQKGQKSLDILKQGGTVADLSWSSPLSIERSNAQSISASVVEKAFRMDTSKLPAYAGSSAIDGSFVLVKVSGVADGLKDMNAEDKKTAIGRYNGALGSEYFMAYVKSLRDRAKITINNSLVVNKDAS
ncbi:MAG TPA: SurA N-terminal domain-containing protein [Methylophilaceae bacterium]